MYLNRQELDSNAKRHVVNHLPRDIRTMLSQNPRKLVVGGGFIRDVLSSTTPTDLDLFCDTAARAKVLSHDLCKLRGGRMHTTQNAITILTHGYMPVQFITRWVYDQPEKVLESFDFTACRAALWRAGSGVNDEWRAQIGGDFYRDLAGRNLVYTYPVREEEAGGSLMRALKFVRRGWHIQIESLAGLVERVQAASKAEDKPIVDLLREVDPLQIIDGLDVVHDHEEPSDGEGKAVQ